MSIFRPFSERLVTLTLTPGPDGVAPGPVHVDMLGLVVNRVAADVPLRLVGFAATLGDTEPVVNADTFWEAPEAVEGMYPVFLFLHGDKERIGPSDYPVASAVAVTAVHI